MFWYLLSAAVSTMSALSLYMSGDPFRNSPHTISLIFPNDVNLIVTGPDPGPP